MSYTWELSGIDGAGFCNVGVQRGDGRVLLGLDVGGIYYSSDHGDTLYAANAHAYAPTHLSVAGIAFSNTEPAGAWACIGKQGNGGGLLHSSDSGKSWTFRSTIPQFSGGNNNDSPLPVPHPRSTFVLRRCLDENNGYMYFPTYSAGLWRTNNGGSSGSIVALSGHYLRAFALNRDDPTEGWAASYGSGPGLSNPGVYHITNLRGTTPTVTLVSGTGAPTTPEDIWLSENGVLFVPSAYEGIKRYDGSWDTLHTDTAAWYSVDGYPIGAEDAVYFGCFDPVKSGTDFQVLKTSVDSGDTLVDLDQSTVNYTINDASGEQWWLSVDQENQMLGKNSSCIAGIDISLADSNRIMLMGRAGVWRTVNAGTDWYPMVRGLGATIHRAPKFLPGGQGHVADGITDWVFIAYNIDTEVAVQNKPSPNTALDVAVDPVSGEILLAVGDRDENTLGRVYSTPSPGTGAWEDTLLQGSQGAFTDLFQRTVTDDWGTADTGDAWVLPAGGEANFDVDGEAGLIVVGANASRDAHQPDAATHVSFIVQVSWDAVAAGGFHAATIKARRNTTTFYGCRLRQLSTNGNVDLVFIISGTASGSPVIIANDVAPNTKFNVKFNLDGVSPTTYQLKAWLDGTDEPEDWTIEGTDNTGGLQTQGTVGLRAQGASGYTGGATMHFHSFECQNNSAVSGSDGKRPLGLCSFRNASNQKVWLAAIEEYGVRVNTNEAGWVDADTTLLMQGAATSKFAAFEYMGNGAVFLWDRDALIGISLDYGQTWSAWWTVISPTDGTGFLAHQDDRLYVVDSQQVRYVDAATTGTVD